MKGLKPREILEEKYPGLPYFTRVSDVGQYFAGIAQTPDEAVEKSIQYLNDRFAACGDGQVGVKDSFIRLICEEFERIHQTAALVQV